MRVVIGSITAALILLVISLWVWQSGSNGNSDGQNWWAQIPHWQKMTMLIVVLLAALLLFSGFWGARLIRQADKETHQARASVTDMLDDVYDLDNGAVVPERIRNYSYGVNQVVPDPDDFRTLSSMTLYGSETIRIRAVIAHDWEKNCARPPLVYHGIEVDGTIVERRVLKLKKDEKTFEAEFSPTEGGSPQLAVGCPVKYGSYINLNHIFDYESLQYEVDS